MDSRTLSVIASGVNGFDMPGGPDKSISKPLLKKVGDEVKIVFFVHISSITTPTDFVISSLDGEELYDRFDEIVWKGDIDWDGYREYVKELISYSDIEGKRFLKAFME